MVFCPFCKSENTLFRIVGPFYQFLAVKELTVESDQVTVSTDPFGDLRYLREVKPRWLDHEAYWCSACKQLFEKDAYISPYTGKPFDPDNLITPENAPDFDEGD